MAYIFLIAAVVALVVYKRKNKGVNEQALRHFNRISVFQLARLISVAVKKYNRPLYAV